MNDIYLLLQLTNEQRVRNLKENEDKKFFFIDYEKFLKEFDKFLNDEQIESEDIEILKDEYLKKEEELENFIKRLSDDKIGIIRCIDDNKKISVKKEKVDNYRVCDTEDFYKILAESIFNKYSKSIRDCLSNELRKEEGDLYNFFREMEDSYNDKRDNFFSQNILSVGYQEEVLNNYINKLLFEDENVLYFKSNIYLKHIL